jgi:hypothetical protein
MIRLKSFEKKSVLKKQYQNVNSDIDFFYISKTSFVFTIDFKSN